MVIYANYSVSTTEFVEKGLLYGKAMKPVYNNKALRGVLRGSFNFPAEKPIFRQGKNRHVQKLNSQVHALVIKRLNQQSLITQWIVGLTRNNFNESLRKRPHYLIDFVPRHLFIQA